MSGKGTKRMAGWSGGGHCTGEAWHRSQPGELLYGNGCTWHPDCFTCPYHDCVAGQKSMNHLERKTVDV